MVVGITTACCLERERRRGRGGLERGSSGDGLGKGRSERGIEASELVEVEAKEVCVM